MRHDNKHGVDSFIIAFLSISTVIVFAVLLFLSYENVLSNSISSIIAETDAHSESIADTVSTVVGSDNEFDLDENDRIIILHQIYRATIRGKNHIGFLVEGDGTIIHEEYAESNYDSMEEALQGIEIDYNEAKNKGKFEAFTTVDNLTTVVSVTPVPYSNYFVVVIMNVGRTEAVETFTQTVLQPAIICFLLIIIVVFVTVRTLLAPIREISKVIEQVGEGNFSVRVEGKNAKGNSDKEVKMTSDISMMGKTVNTMIDSLENQENDRQIFISSVAHDIRTPLTSINGFVTAMMDGTIPPEEHNKYMLLIKNEAQRIRGLVMTMTESSSLAHIDPEMMDEFDIREAIKEIVTNLEPQLKEKNIEVKLNLDESDKATYAYGEAQQLSRVVMNIITNAIKFTPVDGTIIVTTTEDYKENRIRIQIEDSGPGIPEDKRSRVFESFFMLDSSRKQEGFGLGLFICKQILSGHKQNIYVDEGPEFGGARFNFSFPTREAFKKDAQE